MSTLIVPLLIVFLTPLCISLLITPYVIKFAKRIGAIDKPNERKVHTNPIPRLGGVAIYISFFLSVIFSAHVDPALHPFASLPPHAIMMLVISLTMVLMLGIWDDVSSLTPGKKFIGQVLAATIVYFAGFRISSVTHPMDASLLDLGFFQYPATILWIVGITNAFNLIDGLDGLAGGVACIVSGTIFSISLMKGDVSTAMLSLLLGGSILGFLKYNFNGARIFLGDSGSLFIGFTLAILSMHSSTKGSAAFSILVPMLTLGLPIMDTLLSMIRRLVRSLFPEQPAKNSFFGKMVAMFLPDRGHIHHQLMARGLSRKHAVLLLYVVSLLFGVGAFAVTFANNISMTPMLIAVGIATFIGVSQLRYKEMAVLRSGVLLPMYERPLLNSVLFQGFLDLAFIFGAFISAFSLANRGQVPFAFDETFLQSLTITGGVQLGVFYLSGLYNRSWKQFGMGDLLKISKTVILAVIITWTVLAFLPDQWRRIDLPTMILDFYIVLSLVLGARISFHVLNYFSQRENHNGKRKVLIYGADVKGSLMAQQILAEEGLNLHPVGFLDDDPQLEGKRLNGYPILGGHWKLSRLLKKTKIDEIVLSSETIKPIVFQRLISVARAYGVAVRRWQVRFDDVQTPPKALSVTQDHFVFVDK